MSGTFRSIPTRPVAAAICCLAAFNTVSCGKGCAATVQSRELVAHRPSTQNAESRAAVAQPSSPSAQAKAETHPTIQAIPGQNEPAEAISMAGVDPDTPGGGNASASGAGTAGATPQRIAGTGTNTGCD